MTAVCISNSIEVRLGPRATATERQLLAAGVGGSVFLSEPGSVSTAAGMSGAFPESRDGDDVESGVADSVAEDSGCEDSDAGSAEDAGAGEVCST